MFPAIWARSVVNSLSCQVSISSAYIVNEQRATIVLFAQAFCHPNFKVQSGCVCGDNK